MRSQGYVPRSRLYHNSLKNAEEAWNRVQADELGVYASADILFRNAVFGRDSIEVGEDLLPYRPEVARRIIFTLARLQGLRTNVITEEEPGKIHHEYRNNISSVSTFTADIISNWGAVNDELHYFGAIDATPLYVRFVLNFVKLYGDGILQEKYTHKRGDTFTIRESLEMALDWIVRKIGGSTLGLMEYRRTNPKGLQNQIWTDSVHSTIHDDGNTSNFEQPIAPVEVQGYAYDALVYAAGIWKTIDEKKSDLWTQTAEKLRQKTFEHFWTEDVSYFVLGIDRDMDGNPRKIKTVHSNPALLLDSAMFDTLPQDTRRKYMESLIRTVFSIDFLTQAGIRIRSLKYANLLRVRYRQGEEIMFPYTDYQGSKVVWFKQTYDIAKGLRKHGFERLAIQLETRIFNTINIISGHHEFVYVDEEGYILIPHEVTLQEVGEKSALYATNIPERDQSWTLSALLAILSNVKKPRDVSQPKDQWVRRLEQEILEKIPRADYLKSKKDLEEARKTRTRDVMFVRVQEENVSRN